MFRCTSRIHSYDPLGKKIHRRDMQAPYSIQRTIKRRCFFTKQFPQWHDALHGCILVEPFFHLFMNKRDESFRRRKIRKSLRKIDRPRFIRQSTHNCEYGSANIWQLWFDFIWVRMHFANLLALFLSGVFFILENNRNEKAPPENRRSFFLQLILLIISKRQAW